jgi:hypothetical protein
LETPAHRARRNFQAARDLRRRQILVVAQQQHRAIRLGDLEQRARHLALELDALDELVGPRRIGRRISRRFARAPSRVAAQLGARDVAHDAEQPRPQRARAASLLQRLDPDLLHDVVALGGVAHQPPRQPANPRRLAEDVLDRLVPFVHRSLEGRSQPAERWPKSTSSQMRKMTAAMRRDSCLTWSGVQPGGALV